MRQITFFFKDSNTVCLRGIKFDHASGFESPIFETGDMMQCQIKVDRDTIAKTKIVQACCRETQRDSIKSISFSGDKGVIMEVNHYKREIGV